MRLGWLRICGMRKPSAAIDGGGPKPLSTRIAARIHSGNRIAACSTWPPPNEWPMNTGFTGAS